MHSPFSLPPLSVVVVAYEQSEQLKRHLPLILEQEYPSSFEVVVVDMNSSDSTPEVLERLSARYPHLHTAPIPPTARDISHSRLAITLGIRAASNDCVLITQADCYPATSHWLTRMGEAFAQDDHIQMVLGHTRLVPHKGWHSLRSRFLRIWTQLLHYAHAKSHGIYLSDGTNLGYRRSFFLQHRGFADHATLLVGATEIMVNHNSTPTNSCLCLHPDAVVLQEPSPYIRRWYEEQTFFMETRRHLRHTLPLRLSYMAYALYPWCLTLGILATLVLLNPVQHPILALLPPLLWVLGMGAIVHHFNRHVKQLGESPFWFSSPLLLHLVLWWDVTAWFRWLFTRRQTFRKKFI